MVQLKKNFFKKITKKLAPTLSSKTALPPKSALRFKSKKDKKVEKDMHALKDKISAKLRPQAIYVITQYLASSQLLLISWIRQTSKRICIR